MRKHGLTNGKGAEVKAGAGTGPGKDTVACEPVNPAVYSVDRVKRTPILVDRVKATSYYISHCLSWNLARWMAYMPLLVIL